MSRCEICGCDLKGKPFWAKKCTPCWKRTELKKKDISELLKEFKEKRKEVVD